MKRVALLILLLITLATPARATSVGFVDCESVGSWAKHVGVAAAKFVRATVSASLDDLRIAAGDGRIQFDDVGISLQVVMVTLAAHINPQSLLETAGAVMCLGAVED